MNKYLPTEKELYADEKAKKAVEKRLTKEIIDLNQQINDGIKNETSESKKITNEKIEKLKAEKEARQAILEALDPTPKTFTENALIEAGYGREVNIKTKNGVEKRTILDWKKLAGEEGSIENIKKAVEKSLKDKDYTDEQIIRMQDKFADEFVDLRKDIIEKSINQLNARNKVVMTAEQRSAARKLAELYDFGLFDKNPEDFSVLLGKAIGVDKLNQERFDRATVLAKGLQKLYSTELEGKRLTDLELKSAIQVIEEEMSALLNQEAHEHGSTMLKVADYAAAYMDLSQRMALNTLKQATENPLSGQQQLWITKLSTIIPEDFGGMQSIPKELREQISKISRDIYKDMVLKVI